MPTVKLLMPMKRDGKLLKTGSTVEVEADEVAALVADKAIEDPQIEDANNEGDQDDVSLKDVIKALLDAEHEVKSLNMADLGKLMEAELAGSSRGVKRADVDAVLAEIASEQGA